MTRRAALWLGGVFCLTLLWELPAVWLVHALGIPAQGVTGTLWNGQLARLGDVGPGRWSLAPWRAALQVQMNVQGQSWQLRADGWPWRWQVEVLALQAEPGVDPGYRLAGHWQGALRFSGRGRQCQTSDGQLMVEDLALLTPWSLALGKGQVHVDCSQRWRVLGQLALAGQHHITVEGDLLTQRATVAFQVEPDAGLAPVLQAAGWLGDGAAQGQRKVRW